MLKFSCGTDCERLDESDLVILDYGCGAGNYSFFTYIEKNLEGIHFEKVYSPYYQQKGGVTFDSLERGKFMSFEK